MSDKLRFFVNMIPAKVDILQFSEKIAQGDMRWLARALTLVENDISPMEQLLKNLKINEAVPVIGVTGPPGAGKSTLVNAIADELAKQGKKIAILAVDPTSPFNYGSLLGDRIRMSKHFNNPNIFIRSVATRGSLGGLSGKTLEMVDVLRASNFDMIIVETVGVGQSELEIAGLADKTILVLVPEAGDEIQHIKSGLMEVAQAFVVNKADREGAAQFANQLQKMLNEHHQQRPIFKTVADKNEGILPLCTWLSETDILPNEKKAHLLAHKAYQLMMHNKMKKVDKAQILLEVQQRLNKGSFNLYAFVDSMLTEMP